MQVSGDQETRSGHIGGFGRRTGCAGLRLRRLRQDSLLADWTRLVPRLIDHGQKVTGSYRSSGNAERARALDAEPITLDQQPARVRRRTAGSS